MLTPLAAVQDARGSSYPLSIRFDMLCKDQNGCDPAKNWKRVDFDAIQLAEHVSHGYAIAVSQYKGNYRAQVNAEVTRVLGLDFDKGMLSAEDVAAHSVLSEIVAVALPSSSDKPDYPKTRAFCFLSRHADKEDLRKLKTIFLALIGDMGLDPTVVEAARFFYGSLPSRERVYVSLENVLDVDTFITEHAALLTPPPEASVKRARRKRLETEGATLHKNAKTHRRDVRRAKMLVRFILDHYGDKMPNDVWYQFRLAAQAASGRSMEVFNAIAAHPYWRAEWDVEQERYRWATEEPHTVTVGTLYAMAHELGWGTANEAEVSADHTINDVSELPTWDSYLLKAFTGVGKSQAQRATVKGVLSKGKKVCWIVPTKSLARAAAADFADLGASVYLDDEGYIKDVDALRAERFIITTPQTFARRIGAYGLMGYGLLVLDEVQQIANAAFDPHNELWRDRELNIAFLAAIAEAKATEGLILRGLDAGLARGAQEWLGLRVYDCTKRLEKAPVTIFTEQGQLLGVLYEALRQNDGSLVYVTCDTKKVSEQVAAEISRKFPRKRMLVVNGVTVDSRAKGCDRRAVAFMDSPNTAVHEYDVIIVSPTMLTGVSITARAADYVFQFCSYLPPKSNLQMLNRFRRQGQVFVHYSGMGAMSDVKTPEEAAEQAEVLLEHVANVKRSETAMRYETVRYWSEIDSLYQSFDPLAYYAHLLEHEGRQVTHDTDTCAAYKLADTAEDTTAWEWALDNWQKAQEYDPLRRYAEVEEKEMNAMLLKREVNRKTEGGYIVSKDMRMTAIAAHDFKTHQLGLTETAMGTREESTLLVELALDPDTPPSFIRKDNKIITLLSGLWILGYQGETTIPARVFIERGQELVEFLSDNQRFWNAIFPRAKQLALTGDYVADARQCVKDLFSLIGLNMRRGAKTRIMHNGKRQFDAEVENVGELKHLLYLRACGRALKAKTPLPEGIEMIFPDLSHTQTAAATEDALDWFMTQGQETWAHVRAELTYRKGSFAGACAAVKEWMEDGEIPF